MLRTIFTSLACANECMHVHKVRDFSQVKLDSKIKAHFLSSEHGYLKYILLHKFGVKVILFKLHN